VDCPATQQACQVDSLRWSKFNRCYALQVTVPALEKLPPAVAAASLGVDAVTYASLTGSLPKAAFIPNSDPDCVARCQAAGISVLAPAPSAVSASVAGRR
jgi:hypothetical protein